MLAARFHALRDRALARVDFVFAEPVRLSPLKNGAPDPVRLVRQFEAVLRVGEGKVSGATNGNAQGWRFRLTAGKGELHIDRVANPNIDAKVGDKIKALSRPGEPWFEIAHVDDRSHTRLVLELNEA